MTTWQEKVEKFIDEELAPYSPQKLIKKDAHSTAFLAKGFGGRIGQNQPTKSLIQRKFKVELDDRKSIGLEFKNKDGSTFKLRKIRKRYDAVIVIDIDISGCYAESQRVQVFPIGRPIIGGLRLDTISENNYPNLREFLISCKVNVDELCKLKVEDYKAYRARWDELWGELDYGAFNLFIDIPKLKNPLDMLTSWVHPSKKMNHKMVCKLLADAAKGDDKAIDKIKQGCTKKLLNEVGSSPINFDVLEWLFFHATQGLRKEVLDKAKVIAFVIYPKSLRLKSDKPTSKEKFKDCADQLQEVRQNWKPRNSIQLDFNDKFILYGEEYRDCHYWFGETIGDMILNKILSSRKIAQWVKKKSAEDLINKLFCNTHFGVSVSPLFKISNICVGNNITARCRVLAWAMEKSLLGYPTITDGCFYELNRVLKTKKLNINSSCINLDSKNSPLGQFNFKTQPQPLNIEFEDRLFTYKGEIKEYVSRLGRLYGIFEILQTNKDTSETKKLESLYPLDKLPGVKKAHDLIANKAVEHIKNNYPLITVCWIDTERLKAVAIKDEYNKLPSNKRKPEMAKIVKEPREGMADLEIKNSYISGANQGMANYILVSEKIVITGKGVCVDEKLRKEFVRKHIEKSEIIYSQIDDEKNPEEMRQKTDFLNRVIRRLHRRLDAHNEQKQQEFIRKNKSKIGNLPVTFKESEEEVWIINIELEYTSAYRGYESSKPHVGIIDDGGKMEIVKRYEKTINPALDFMRQLLLSPNKIKRQYTVIKSRSISVGDYKNNSKKFKELGDLEPGDWIKVALLFTEFSASQFTYKNKKQLFGWADAVATSKDKFGQSVEAWFIDGEGDLRYQDMINWAADAVERGVIDPIKELSKYGKRSKGLIGNPRIKISEEDRYHPEYFVYSKAKLMLGNGEYSEDLLKADEKAAEEIDRFVEDVEELVM